jgi:hypothetical protein
MAYMNSKHRRRACQYWIATGLSVLIPVTALLGEQSNVSVPMNAALFSLLLLGVTSLELLNLHPWQEIGQLVCAAWLTVSPFVWNYSNDALAYCHVAIGLLLALLAGYNIWQDQGTTVNRPSLPRRAR